MTQELTAMSAERLEQIRHMVDCGLVYGWRDADGAIHELIAEVERLTQLAAKPAEHFWYDVSDHAWRELKFAATQDEALKACKAAIQDTRDGDGWGMDEDDLQQFVVGTITHRAVVHAHIGLAEECESSGLPGDSEIWEVKLEEVK